MSGHLTTATVMTCPHGGTVQGIPSSPRAQAGGAPMLSAADTFMIAGCPFVLGLVPSPCLTVQWVQPATRGTSSGAPLLTLASVGMCVAATAAVQGTVLISSTQSNVTGE
jgi:hypothetical protein